MERFKKAVSWGQDWSDEEQVIEKIDRATADRQQLEQDDGEVDAWVRDQISQAAPLGEAAGTAEVGGSAPVSEGRDSALDK